MERPVVLCGMGRVGWRVLEALRAAGLTVTVVDLRTSPDDSRLKGLKFIQGDCRDPEVLTAAGVREARGVVIVTSDDLANISTALLARRLNKDARIVVRMFNQDLMKRLGPAAKNMAALSVSALTAPLLALTAVTGDTLGAFKLHGEARQVAEVAVTEIAKLSSFTGASRVVPIALIPTEGEARLLLDVPAEQELHPGDRLVVCGAPADVRALLDRARGDRLTSVRWAGAMRRWLRTVHRTISEIDLPTKVCTVVLLMTLLASTLVFRYGAGTTWAEGFYQTVSVSATGDDLHGENRSEWFKIFLGALRILGAALIAGFTAVFTNYLLRARLGGALELRRVPDGGHIVVCGLGNVGYRCVEELTALGERVVAVDSVADNPFLATCRRKGVAAFVGDATVAEVLRQARIDTAKAVLAVTSKELINLEIALLVRERNPDKRLVVRLTEPEFAVTLREAANIRHAVSVPALAAPAFAAALFGDHVQALVTAAGRTLAIVDFTVQEDDPCLNGVPLGAAMIDYRFLTLSEGSRGQRLKAGDRLTLIAEMPDLERLLRREPASRGCSICVEEFPAASRDTLTTLVRFAHRCDGEQAERMVGSTPFTLATHLTRGEAEEMLAQVLREGVTAKRIDE